MASSKEISRSGIPAFPLTELSVAITQKKRKTIIEHTRKNYAKSKAEVEAENQRYRQIPEVTREVQPERNSLTENQSNEVREESNLSITPVIHDSSVVTSHGRGGKHHQELQAVIKRMAESYGFAVEIEKNVLDGAGSVDVSLEKENLKIACEVSVTTTNYEMQNVLKCLAAGYDYVIVVVSNQKKLPTLKAKLRSDIPLEQLDKVKVFGLTGLLSFLRELTATKEPAQKPAKPRGQRLDFNEACEFFGVGASTLYRWIREGRVPFYRPGREYQFDRDELVLIGKHDLSGKRKALVKLSPLKIDKSSPKTKKEQDSRYRKLLKLE